MSFNEVQSLWQVPSVYHFCSVFGNRFIQFNFSIEDLEDALVNNQKWIEVLMVRFLEGQYRENVSCDNYNFYLRRLILKRRLHYGNPLNHPLQDMDFFELSLATKAEVLHELCMLCLDKARASESSLVSDASQNSSSLLEQIQLRPFGCVNSDVYWYFGGRRLYGEKAIANEKTSWHVVCSTSEDWFTLRERLSKGRMKSMKEMHAKIAELCDRRDFDHLFSARTRMRERKQLQMLFGHKIVPADVDSPKEASRKRYLYRLTENFSEINSPKNKNVDNSENLHLKTKQNKNMPNNYRTRLRELNK